MYTDKQIKRIKFWLQRTCEEKMTQSKAKIEEASTLNFQRHNFDEMREQIQEEVVGDLLLTMRKCFGDETTMDFLMELKDN